MRTPRRKKINYSSDQLGLSPVGKDGRQRVATGKGDAPRSCQSTEFRDNYDDIDWGEKGDTE